MIIYRANGGDTSAFLNLHDALGVTDIILKGKSEPHRQKADLARNRSVKSR